MGQSPSQLSQQSQSQSQSQPQIPQIPEELNQFFTKLANRQEKPECGVDCLKTKWINSKKLYKDLPEEIQENEKKYYVADKGEAYYKNSVQKKKYVDHIDSFKKNENKKFKDARDVNDSLLANYTTSTLAKSRVDQLYEELFKQNKELTKKIDNYKKKVFTDERKVYYENQSITKLEFYKKILLCVYYLVLVSYILFGPFFRKRGYANYKIWIIMVLYGIFPYLLTYIINYAFNI